MRHSDLNARFQQTNCVSQYGTFSASVLLQEGVFINVEIGICGGSFRISTERDGIRELRDFLDKIIKSFHVYPKEYEGPNHMIGQILREIYGERLEQIAVWGDQLHSQLAWLAILTEEVGECAKEIQDKSEDQLRDELIQVAAVAVAAVESLERRGMEGEGTFAFHQPQEEEHDGCEDCSCRS